MSYDKPISVLFVCMGNICRSPMAEAVFRHLVQEAGLAPRFKIASVGTGGWHVGERPHPGTQAVLQRNGVAVGDQRAQRLSHADLDHYDYIIAMDEENLDDISRLRHDAAGTVRRLLEFAPAGGPLDVPDPYYTGGFDQVYDLVTAGCRGLLLHIRAQEGV
jgi:protein-tyrosine phosphatase